MWEHCYWDINLRWVFRYWIKKLFLFVKKSRIERRENRDVIREDEK